MREAGLTADSMQGARSKERVVSVRSESGLTPPPSVFHCVAEAPWLVIFFRWSSVLVRQCWVVMWREKSARVPGHMRRTTVPLICGSAFVGDRCPRISFRFKEGSWEVGAVMRSRHCEVMIIVGDRVMFSRLKHSMRNCARRGSLVFHTLFTLHGVGPCFFG